MNMHVYYTDTHRHTHPLITTEYVRVDSIKMGRNQVICKGADKLNVLCKKKNLKAGTQNNGQQCMCFMLKAMRNHLSA